MAMVSGPATTATRAVVKKTQVAVALVGATEIILATRIAFIEFSKLPNAHESFQNLSRNTRKQPERTRSREVWC